MNRVLTSFGALALAMATFLFTAGSASASPSSHAGAEVAARPAGTTTHKGTLSVSSRGDKVSFGYTAMHQDWTWGTAHTSLSGTLTMKCSKAGRHYYTTLYVTEDKVGHTDRHYHYKLSCAGSTKVKITDSSRWHAFNGWRLTLKIHKHAGATVASTTTGHNV